MRYCFDGYSFDQGSAQLKGPAGVIALRPMTLKLLQALLEAAPDVVSNDDLLDRVWGRQAVVPGVIAQSIAELRKALNDSAQESRYIETRHRLGYRFCAQLERGEPASAAEAAAAVANPVTARPGRAALWAAVFGLPLALLLTVLWSTAERESAPAFYPIDVVQAGTPIDRQAQQWFRQALTELRERKLDRAVELLERALEREPDSAAALATLAAIQAEHGQMRRAQALVESALQAGADLERTERLRIAGLDAALNLRWGEAIERYQAVFQLNPGDVLAGLALFRAQLSAGRSAEAERTLADLANLPAALLEPAQLALARARLASLRGRSDERRDHAAAAIELADQPRSRSEARLELIAALIALGDLSTAQLQLDELVAILQADPWPAGELRREMLLGQWQREAGQPALAIDHYNLAAQRAEELGDARSASSARREAAYAQIRTGAIGDALAAVDAALEAQRERGDLREVAASLNVRSVALQRAGDMPAAQADGEEALSLYLQADDRAGQAGARNNLGMLYGRAGRSEEAQNQFEAALDAFRAIGNRRGAAVALGNIAALHGRAGRATAAREANEAALAEFQAVGAALDAARLHFNLALQDRRAGRLGAAEAGVRAALDGFAEAQAATPALVATATLADLLLRRAELDKAEALLQSALDDPAAPKEQRAGLLSVAGQLALLRADHAQAQQHFDAALKLRTEAGLSAWARLSELDLAELRVRQRDWADAEARLRVLRRAMLDDGEMLDAALAGGLLAVVLQEQGLNGEAGILLQELESVASSDAGLALRLDLIRAHRHPDRGSSLLALANRARESGYERLALTAERLGDEPRRSEAELALRARGINLGETPLPW